jgi:hypothetical protein
MTSRDEDAFIIVTRNPNNGRVVVITDGDSDDAAQYATAGEADIAAQNTTVCMAWGYQVVEVY